MMNIKKSLIKLLSNSLATLLFSVPLLSQQSTDSMKPKRTALEFDTKVTSFKFGLGYIHDYSAHSQNYISKQQMDSAGVEVKDQFKVRDFRLLGSGKFHTKREFTWKFAFMYDGAMDTWLIRETGIAVGVPELRGHFFIGRTKEGYSMVKVMNGHSPWTFERQMSIDLIPILADGIKYYGHLEKSRIFWNMGYFNDILSKGQGFSTFEWQGVARIGWMPVYNKETSKALHLAINMRYGKPMDNKFIAKSRPESNPTPFFINTGSFITERSLNSGFEIYYNYKKLMLGSEINYHSFYSKDLRDHHFFGGDVVLSYMFTNTTRPYNQSSSIFGFVPVRKSIFNKGWGELEGVLRFSTFNLTDGDIQGGKLFRITPMINWYMTKFLRFEIGYGYAVLDRFQLKGITHLFQSRIQLTLL